MPNQIQLDILYLKMAKEVALLSKCVSHKVGCVIVKDGRPIANGYNGTPSGYQNCDEIFGWSLIFDREEHIKFSDQYEIHAELNAILFCAKNGLSIKDATIYCSLEPCYQCMKNIIQAGIKRVVYRSKYDRLPLDYEFIKECGVTIEQIEI